MVLEKNKRDIDSNRFVSSLSYIWILCLVPLFLKRKSHFAQFHAKQGLLLFAIEIIGGFIFWIPIIGWALFVMVIIYSIMGVQKTMSGEYWVMPFVGKYVSKLNL